MTPREKIAAVVTTLLVGLTAACSEDTRITAPTPVSRPAPSTPAPTQPVVTITGTITDTVTGARVGTFTQTTASLPAQVTVAQAGYLTRGTWVASATPTVDLFPERGFDLAFYRQLARDGFQGTTRQPLWVLPSAPAFYVQMEGAAGLSRQTVTRLEAVARRVMPQLTGGRFHVARWETGTDAKPPQPGWIVVTRREEQGICGRARVGALSGEIWLSAEGACQLESLFAHELGHALGFFHTNVAGSMMYPRDGAHPSATDSPTERERHHAALAYARPRGNTDLDTDPQRPVSWQTAIVVD